MIFDMTKRKSGGEAIVGTTKATDQSMVIPKVDGKPNIFAYVDLADDELSTYFSSGGRAVLIARTTWMGNQVFSVKTTGTGTPPTSYQSGFHNTIFITETSSELKVKFPNSNTVGSLLNDTPIKYILW